MEPRDDALLDSKSETQHRIRQQEDWLYNRPWFTASMLLLLAMVGCAIT